MAHGFSLTLSHVGYFVTDITRMVDFYTRFLKFVVSDRGDRDDGGAIVFMTRDPKEHHQLVFASGKPADLPFNVINQIHCRETPGFKSRRQWVAEIEQKIAAAAR